MNSEINPSNMRVALLAGGISGERNISLESAKGASVALKEAGFEVVQLDPSSRLDLQILLNEPFDVAFLCMHGKYGEDGTLQGLLEVAQIPYTGSKVWASALAMDKAKAKVFYKLAGINTPESVCLKKGEFFNVDNILELVGQKVVVKPATEGSALGVFIVEGIVAVEQAIEQVFKIDNEVIIETYIKGKELTVAVLGNNEVEVLPVIEIVPKNDFYDFESKYAIGGSNHLCPAPVSEEVTIQLQKNAIAAHKALSCSGVSRSDFILDENEKVWILETNTIPGMTATSLLPDAALTAGISFPELCVKLITYALE